eukprot:TRINITY_DN1426_c0_g1_i1.p1 TRINITY_DN1426_c0_g1~~TRINITY_DN1426_c0_g1_i1.p1  ORF type:complete len:373 (+),score=80.16 TRINITY_DN1426_c0_g1_i1:46-1164(+)
MSGSIQDVLKRFDLYPKTLEDYRVKTVSGAFLSIVSLSVMAILFLSQLITYLSADLQNELIVDTAVGGALKINLDIVFPQTSCSYLSLDIMDMSGKHELDIKHSIFKKRIVPNNEDNMRPIQQKELGGVQVSKNVTDPNYCGSCYGAEPDAESCCNTCADVRNAYRKKGWAFVNSQLMEQCVAENFVRSLESQAGEGCNIFGQLEVSKVTGNFHIAPGRSFVSNGAHIHDLAEIRNLKLDLTHEIRKLSFGDECPGVVNPLEGLTIESPKDGENHLFQYFIKVVPTEYINLSGEVIHTNQYSVTDNVRTSSITNHELPGVFVVYDLSPIKVRITESRRSFGHFLANVCAIIGGVFTVSGIIDSLLHKTIASQ